MYRIIVHLLRLLQFHCFFCLSSVIQRPLSSSNDSPFNQDFDTLTSELLERWHTPGLAIAVIDGDQTFSKGYGFERLPDFPVTPSTLFYTASTTKSFTAAAISLLIDDTASTRNPLKWQTPIVTQLRDDFVLQDSYMTNHITLEDALSHRTGQPGHDLSWVGTNTSVRDVVRKLRHLPPTAEVRTEWQYNNMMFVVVSHFVEKVTGLWLGDFLKTRIYEPLNMTNTFFALSDAKAAVATGSLSLSQGYAWNNLTKSHQALAYMNFQGVSGAGATISNVLDYAKWIRCLMTMSPPLSLAGHAALRLPRITHTPLFDPHSGFGESDSYALGLDISFYRGELLIWHSGGLPGFGTFMAFLPGKQWGVVTMENTVESGAGEVLMFKLIDDLLGIPTTERYDWENETLNLLAEGKFILEHAREIGFPNAPEPPLPLTLPLEAYVGLYAHAAYPSINMTLSNLLLRDGDDQKSSKHQHLLSLSYYHLNGDPIYIYLEHVSGEFFLFHFRVYTDEEPKLGSYDPWLDSVTKAEFRIGEDGAVKELGVTIEPAMDGEKIWWQRV